MTWGMLPSEFRECTLYEICEYMIANYKREKLESKKRRIEIYEQAKVNAIFQRINLSNFARKENQKIVPYPKFEEIFDEKDNEKNKNKNIYEKIDTTNATEFLLKQKHAYEKAGITY